MMPKSMSLLVVAIAMISCTSVFAEEPSKRYEVEIVKQVSYVEGTQSDPVRHRLDLYLPKGLKDFPVLFFVHGGAWRSGNKELYAKMGDVFAARGIGAVIINYRLSPQVKHPAHIEDVAQAFAWVVNNIEKYHGRKDCIFVSGHSAGGHLISLLTTDPTYLKAVQRSVQDIRGVIPISGVYSLFPIGIFTQVFGTDAKVMKSESPREQVSQGLPPFLILYGDADFPTCDLPSKLFCQKLIAQSVVAECQSIASRDHIQIIREAMRGDDPTTNAMLAFVRKHTTKGK